MPTYEYECKSCGYTFDAFQSMSDDPLKICPQCGKDIRRLINGGSGVIFKGSGFYVTDKKGGAGGSSSSKGPSKAASAETSAEAQKGRSSPPGAPACPGCAKAETPSCPKAANS
jgi:putative FmdB family regulatory protein